MCIYSHSKVGGADALNKQVKIKWVWLNYFAHHIDLYVDVYPGVLAQMEHRYSRPLCSKSFGMPDIDEIVTAITKDSNTHDRFAVALSAHGVGMVEHVHTS